MAKQAVEELRQRLDILLKKMEIQAEYMDRVVKAIEEYELEPEPPYREQWGGNWQYVSGDTLEVLPAHAR
jgi:hypothetical protein